MRTMMCRHMEICSWKINKKLCMCVFGFILCHRRNCMCVIIAHDKVGWLKIFAVAAAAAAELKKPMRERQSEKKHVNIFKRSQVVNCELRGCLICHCCCWDVCACVWLVTAVYWTLIIIACSQAARFFFIRSTCSDAMTCTNLTRFCRFYFFFLSLSLCRSNYRTHSVCIQYELTKCITPCTSTTQCDLFIMLACAHEILIRLFVHLSKRGRRKFQEQKSTSTYARTIACGSSEQASKQASREAISQTAKQAGGRANKQRSEEAKRWKSTLFMETYNDVTLLHDEK